MATDGSAREEHWPADRYARDARFVTEYGVELLDLLAARSGERILDLGCGDGVLASRIRERGAKVVGIDSSQAMVSAARARGVDARLGRAEALAFDGEFDAAFSNAALHWVPAADAVLAGVARALRPGGRLVVEQGGAGNIAAVRAALAQELRAGFGIVTTLAEIWYFPTPAEHRARLEAAGFAVDDMRLFRRPTPVPAMTSWLRALAAPVLALLPAGDREAFTNRVADRLAPELRGPHGTWSSTTSGCAIWRSCATAHESSGGVRCRTGGDVRAPGGVPQEIEVTVLEEPLTDAESSVEPADEPAVVAVLRGLDKVTGVAVTFEAPVGATTEFGRLELSVKACNGRAPDEPPESAAFLQIRDTRRPGSDELAFSGWMFASSPGLSAMDHARYDVWVLSCSTR